MEGIVARGVVKGYDDVQALRGVSLEVGRGEIVALLGENGAGKSTLIRILATTVLPDAGTTTVLGHDVARAGPKVRSLTGVMLGNERSWYWRLSGRRNLEFFAALYGLRRREAAARADALLEQVGLREAADRRFDGYSAGMRARLSLARALLREPPVLLLDEPTQALDPVAGASFRELVLRLSRERGTSTLLATHNLHEAAMVSNRVVVLAHGEVASTAAGADAAHLEQALLTAVAA